MPSCYHMYVLHCVLLTEYPVGLTLCRRHLIRRRSNARLFCLKFCRQERFGSPSKCREHVYFMPSHGSPTLFANCSPFAIVLSRYIHTIQRKTIPKTATPLGFVDCIAVAGSRRKEPFKDLRELLGAAGSFTYKWAIVRYNLPWGSLLANR